MNLVVAVDQNWAIGKDGNLLYHIPADMAHFRELTTGNTVIYGRKTLDTFPNAAPLPNRTNIILTHDPDFTCDGATIAHSIDELENLPPNNLYIIGGESIYRQLFNRCKYAYITHIETTTPDCDAFFPDLSKLKNWERLDRTPTIEYKGIPYYFATYRNRELG